jgi:hypothetical protein
MYVYIVVAIIVSLSAFACYALIARAIENQHIQKQRMLMMLRTKYRNLLHMHNGFPKHFLTTHLASLIYKGLIDTCDHLSKVEPNNQRYPLEMASLISQLEELSVATSVQKIRVDSPHQMKEIHQHLQALQGYLQQQAELKLINKRQHSGYQDQIKNLSLQLSADTYTYHAEDAQQAGKLRLAIHYLTLAKKLLFPERANPAFTTQLHKIEALLTHLEEKALAYDDAAAAQNSEALADSNEENHSPHKKEKEAESWKKKQVYD